MDEHTVFIKTEQGRNEVRSRTLKLAQPLRTLLIATDGYKSLGTLEREYTVGNGARPLLRQLLDLGLIETLDKAAARTSDPSDTAVDAAPHSAFERFRRATQFLNESTSLLGLGGYFFSLKIQRCGSLDELRALAPEFRKALVKRRGESDAEELMRRFHDLVG